MRTRQTILALASAALLPPASAYAKPRSKEDAEIKANFKACMAEAGHDPKECLWHLKFDNCLMTDNRGPNHDGEEFCIKDGKGISQDQIDAWYLKEAKKSIAKQEANRLFNVTPEQYSRGLQLMKAKGLFDSYTHSCEPQTDGTGYRCEDHAGHIGVAYYADNEIAQINSVTVGASPENAGVAALIAAGTALSLNTKFVSLPTASPMGGAMLLALQSEIQRNMDRIFISGGSDVSMTNDAMFVYFLNTDKDMSLVSITRRAPL